MMISNFGITIRETIDVLLGTAAGGPSKKGRKPAREQSPALSREGDELVLLQSHDQLLIYARLVISCLVTFVGCYLVMVNAHQSQTIGAGILGAVTGYWLR